jgi:hypothetical protein
MGSLPVYLDTMPGLFIHLETMPGLLVRLDTMPGLLVHLDTMAGTSGQHAWYIWTPWQDFFLLVRHARVPVRWLYYIFPAYLVISEVKPARRKNKTFRQQFCTIKSTEM